MTICYQETNKHAMDNAELMSTDLVVHMVLSTTLLIAILLSVDSLLHSNITFLAFSLYSDY